MRHKEEKTYSLHWYTILIKILSKVMGRDTRFSLRPHRHECYREGIYRLLQEEFHANQPCLEGTTNHENSKEVITTARFSATLELSGTKVEYILMV